MARKIQFRRGTAASWTSTDPTLAIGELGLETDTGKIKIGDGVTAWSARPYIDAAALAHIADTSAAHAAASIASTPAGTLAATDVQAALNELDTEKAPLASPALTGTPTAPTAATATDTTQVATTAFVRANRAEQAAADISQYGALAVGGLAPKQRVVPMSTGRRSVTSFQSGHGWTNAFPYGSVADDTTDYVIGTRSLKITTGVGTSEPTAAQNTGQNLDLTGRVFGLWMKIADTSKVDQINFYAGPDGFASSWNWTFGRGTDQIPLWESGQWQYITLPWAAAATGSPTRSDVDSLRIRVVPTSGQTAIVNVQQVFTDPEQSAFPNGVCSIMFDDGWSSALTAARTMGLYGYRGSLCAIPENLGLANYLTAAELKQLHDVYGWEVSVHGEPVLTTLTTPERIEEWSASKQYFIDNAVDGNGIDHLAYPGGQVNASVIADARAFFASGRSAAEPALGETLPPADIWKVRAVSGISSFSGGITASTIETRIQDAKTYKRWLVLVFHRIGTVSSTIDCSAADFATILARLATEGVPVVPYGEVLARLA